MATAATKTYRLVGKKRVWDMDRNDTTRFPFDWTTWLAKEGVGVLIASVEWILAPGVVNVNGGNDTHTASITVKFLDPEAVTGLQIVTCRMTTNESTPQVRDRSIYLNPVTE
jgi:hypothetical protein